MRNVIIIDDRKPIQQLVSKMITKEFPECNIVGKVASATESAEIIDFHEPEIIIANIDNLKNEEVLLRSRGKVILFADNIDEKNVHILLKKNVFDILLGTFSYNDLKLSLEKLLISINDEEKEKKRMNNQMAYCMNNISYIRQRVLFDLIVGNYGYDGEKIKEDFESSYLEIREFYIILFSIKPKEDVDDERSNRMLVDILNHFQMASDEIVNVYHVFMDMRNLVLIFKDELEYFTEKYLYSFCTKTVDDVSNKHNDFFINVAISSKGRDFNDVNEKYVECLKELEKVNSSKANHIFCISRVRKLYESRNFRQRMIMHRKDFINALSIADFKNAEYYMSKIIEESCNIKEDEWDFAERFYTHIILDLDDIRREVSEENGFWEINVYNLEQMIRECIRIEDLNDILRMTVRDLIERMKNEKKLQYSNSVNEAIGYIESNYQKSITLEDVAAHVHLSAVHVSRIFNNETGENIKSYLNKLRIKKAKVLLKTGKFRINEVAEKVGFEDSRYFSTVFKKYEEISPTDYLNKIDAGE